MCVHVHITHFDKIIYMITIIYRKRESERKVI